MIHHRNLTLDLFRVLGIFFVMLIHSPITGDIKSNPEIFFFKDFIASGAVPAFFILSGYFGAKSFENKTLNIGAFSKEKLRTLIIPFLIWNTLALILVFTAKALEIDSAFKGGGAYFDVNFSFHSISFALLGIGRFPIVYQFWFLRDLIVVVFLAFAICRYLPKIPLLPILFLIIPVSFLSSLGYYLMGNYLYSYLPQENFPKPKPSVYYCASWLLMGIGILTNFLIVPYPLKQIGSAAFLFMFAVVLSKKSIGIQLSKVGPAVFFIYATHEPLQTICAKIWQLVHLPFYGTIFCFLIIPIIIFPLCFISYRILKLVAPRFLAVATGGR